MDTSQQTISMDPGGFFFLRLGDLCRVPTPIPTPFGNTTQKHWYSKIFCYFSWQRCPKKELQHSLPVRRQLSGEKAEGVGRFGV